MSDGTGEKTVTVSGNVDGSIIITGDDNIIEIKPAVTNIYSDQQLSEIKKYLEEFLGSLISKDDWQQGRPGKGTGRRQESVIQQLPLASAYLWKKLASGEKELNTTLRAVASGGAVRLNDPDIKLRIAQAEIAAQQGQSANANSQTGAELLEHLSKLVRDDQDESSINKLSLNLSLPDIEAKRLIQLEIDYRVAYRLKVEVKTLTGETINIPASITLFQKEAPQREVCQYTIRRGESVQIPEIGPGLYLLQIASKDVSQMLWKMDMELSSVADRRPQRDF